MKGLLVGLLVLGSFSTFASTDKCTAYIQAQKGERALVKAIKKSGYDIVGTEDEADIVVKLTTTIYGVGGFGEPEGPGRYPNATLTVKGSGENLDIQMYGSTRGEAARATINQMSYVLDTCEK